MIPILASLLLVASATATLQTPIAHHTDRQQLRHLTSEVDDDLAFECSAASTECKPLGGNNFQLTESSTFTTASAIWANTPLYLEGSFEMETYVMMNAPTTTRGEGMALVFQTEGPDALGAAGNGKGYQGISGPFVAIDIDTYTDSDHAEMSIVQDTPDSVLIGPVKVGNILDLKHRTLRVNYDATIKEMRISFQGHTVLFGTLDLVELLGGAQIATWGFTASSGVTVTSDQFVYFKHFENEEPAPSQAPSQAPSNAPSSPPTTTFLYEDFNKATTDWSFEPNVFYGTLADNSHAVGEVSDEKFGKWINGSPTGGLRVQLISGLHDVSGGWEINLVVTEDVESATLELDYAATLEGTAHGDFGEVLVELDDTLTVLARLHGGDDSYQGQWDDGTVELGPLSAGTYPLKIGGFLSASTTQGNVFQLRLDNIVVYGMGS